MRDYPGGVNGLAYAYTLEGNQILVPMLRPGMMVIGSKGQPSEVLAIGAYDVNDELVFKPAGVHYRWYFTSNLVLESPEGGFYAARPKDIQHPVLPILGLGDVLMERPEPPETEELIWGVEEALLSGRIYVLATSNGCRLIGGITIAPWSVQ